MSEPLKPLQFVANLTDRQYSLMMSGKGNRCLIELEAYNLYAAIALVGMAQYTGREFLVTVQEITTEKLAELRDETTQKPEGKVTRVGKRGTSNG